MASTFISDFQNAVAEYPTANCQTEIVNFSIIGGGTTLQTGEVFQFKVKLTNQSHLDMRNVVMRVDGTNYADVRLAVPMPFLPYADSAAFNLDAHQSYTTPVYFQGMAKAVTNGAKTIVTARIGRWDANLTHILNDHSGAGAKEGVLSKDITKD